DAGNQDQRGIPGIDERLKRSPFNSNRRPFMMGIQAALKRALALIIVFDRLHSGARRCGRLKRPATEETLTI
ncbi:MAG TPA: hypothetical protein VIX12_08125, partial [Candidatus Binataceae bacterium]